ncbi:hypothetical protein [Parafrankia sp. FMc2]|uniref:hypothetical protein n=1 Tax=Parafrankia sp. FMc2 TaxID=3233196 RepID=UPI0034D78467
MLSVRETAARRSHREHREQLRTFEAEHATLVLADEVEQRLLAGWRIRGDEAERLAADLAFRACRELLRGAEPCDLLALDLAALRWAGIDPGARGTWYLAAGRVSAGTHLIAGAVRGSNTIEGYTVDVADAEAIAAGEEMPTAHDAQTRAAVTGYADALTYVLQAARFEGPSARRNSWTNCAAGYRTEIWMLPRWSGPLWPT